MSTTIITPICSWFESNAAARTLLKYHQDIRKLHLKYGSMNDYNESTLIIINIKRCIKKQLICKDRKFGNVKDLEKLDKH